MQPHDPKTRTVAGITCSGVMEVLSAYADGEVDRNVATQIEAHVAGCRWCEQFGGGFGQMLQTMRTRLAEADPLPTDVESRLRATLAQVR
jgi:predicted anti-sigma-YlaC factor YlaD